ncbi:hypothetical protein ACOJCM_14750 [Billgrantia sp. LNSP4103-1]|uniref:hypothetical protein n=1 Tax=Billgrantia sp. LNSP4103-1 TaxID=3410266 RepID=UPI00403F5266
MRDLEKRLERLESRQHDSIVQAISDLIDELSDKAAGGDGTQTRSELLDLLEDHHATS